VAEPGELIGVLRRWSALESWAGAAKLGVIRELIRADDFPFLNGPRHGDLPGQWSGSLTHEVALALASSAQSADKTMRAACELAARLPGTGRLIADGTLTVPAGMTAWCGRSFPGGLTEIPKSGSRAASCATITGSGLSRPRAAR
jgi:hypothetical protein